MIHIQKHSPPNKFVEFLQQNKNAHFDDMPSEVKQILRDSLLDDMPSEVKQILRDSLLKEQGYLCAYCMSRIDEKNIKIEHYVPQNNENELDYKNLLAVCEGNSFGNEDKYQHCDTKKGNKTLKIDPQNKYHISKISYKPDGTIYSNEFNDDLNKILNLNGNDKDEDEDKDEDKDKDEGYLKNNRKTALNALKMKIKLKYKDKTATLNFLKKTLNFYTSLN